MEDITDASRSLWARGLKLEFTLIINGAAVVALLVGAWIETNLTT
jgi:hypothetical protein